ncbi:MAG: rhodanese-like domain-containing protein [Thermoanaerobaculales bacterium]|jgi:rhodanese-related sulfurtransferase|nr:rhodanese-like domain-containing protein [Thermoanaerobaculales bacterium]
MRPSAVVESRQPGAVSGWRRSLVEAVVLTIFSVVVGLAINAARPHGLPLIASTPYEILVPCPEPGGPVERVTADDPGLFSPRTFLVDARGPADFAAGHLPGAVNLCYDWLDPVPEADLLALASEIAASGATRVVVYGDGGRPDSGEHLGREISGRGIKNVSFLEGGAPAVAEEIAP